MIFTAHAHEMRATAFQIMPNVSAMTLKTKDDDKIISLIFRNVTADQLQALADEFNVIIAIGEAAANDAGQ